MRGGQATWFTHLLVKNWRSFLKADAELGGRVFLAGPSAAGKSSLLDVFRFLGELVSTGRGFQDAVRRRGGVRRLRCLEARQDSDLGFSIRAGEWEYELYFNQEGQPHPVIKRERLSRGGEDILVRPDGDDAADPERLTHTALEQGSLNIRLRDFGAFLKTVRYAHPVPQLMREPERSGVLEQMVCLPEKSSHARLRLILEALQAAVPRLVELEAHRDAHGQPHLRARYEHWRPRGAWQTEEQLSDGTLRLIGLLWAALDGNGPLLIEEPEISLHSQVVRLIPPMLARLARRTGRQVVLTTHSLDLLCAEGVETGEILLLNPQPEGTTLRPALELGEAATLLDRGALAVEPPPQPAAADDRQMGLFSGEPPE